MKLSECKLGIVVQNKDKTYDEATQDLDFGHIESFDFELDEVYVTIKVPSKRGGYKYVNYLPEQLKLLED